MFPSPPRTKRYESSPRKKKQHSYIISADSYPDLNQVSISLCNGLDIKDVDPSLYPQLIPFMQVAARQMYKQQNYSAASEIEKAFAYINEKELEMNESDYENIKDDHRKPTQEEIDYNVNLVMTENAVEKVDRDLYKPVIGVLRKIKDESLKNENYSDLEKAENGIREIIRLNDVQHIANLQNTRIEKYDTQLQNAQKKLEATRKKYAVLLKEAEKEHNEEIRKLDEDFDKTLAIFDNSTDTSEGRKPSPLYLQMQKKMFYLSKSRRYEEAATLRDELKKLEAQEKKSYEERVLAERDLQRREMIKKHNEKIRVTKQKYETKKDSLVKQRNKELDSLRKISDNMKTKLEETEEITEIIIGSPTQTRELKSPKKTSKFNETPNRRKKASTPRKTRGSLPLLKRNDEGENTFTPEMFRQKRKANQIMYSRSPLLYGATMKTPRRGDFN